MHHADKEHFNFTYNRKCFDCILSISHVGYELLVAIHSINIGILIKINNRFVAELTDEQYYKLCDALDLSYSKGGFSSHVFLTLLSSHIPTHYSGFTYTYEQMRSYLICRHVDEAEKIYFKGWNDHVKDKRSARNFSKTEFYFGKEVADYCRCNNISSLWTDVECDEVRLTKPWD